MSDASTTSNKTAPLKTSAFKIPGEGPSALISIATVTAILVLWFASTNLGWIKPLFLPSPQATFQQFYEYITGAANDKPLWEHFAASMFRVFTAFFLACTTSLASPSHTRKRPSKKLKSITPGSPSKPSR